MSQSKKKADAESRRRRQRAFNLAVLAITFTIIILITVYALSNSTSFRLPNYLNTCLPNTGKPVYISTPQIVIKINGAVQTIPSGIGVLGSCIRPISTRSGAGIIHIDAFEDRIYLLSDFFLVWGSTFGAQYAKFNQNQIFNLHTDSNHTLTMTVNNAIDTRFQDYPFPVNANFTSPATADNIQITYG